MPGTRIPLYQVDAFSDVPFSGNPAAVCLLQQPLDDETRQKIAAEMNLSETAFLEAPGYQPVDFSKDTRFKLRWFTPTREVDLCGHATVAAAAALIHGQQNQAKEFFFDTLHSGQLIVTHTPDGQLALDMPHAPLDSPVTCVDVTALTEALFAPCPAMALLREVGMNKRLGYILIHTDRTAVLRGMVPNMELLRGLQVKGPLVGVIVTAIAEPESGYDFLSRFFAPWGGIEEDPVTGSAHAVLGPYWAQLLGTTQLRARQVSPRGGDLLVDVQYEAGRVTVTGSALLVVQGELLL